MALASVSLKEMLDSSRHTMEVVKPPLVAGKFTKAGMEKDGAARTNPYWLKISHSSVNLFRSCPRKFEFRKFYENIDQELSVPAEAGHALHQGMQDYLIHKDRDRAIWTMMTRYPIELCSNPTDARSLEACYTTLNAMIDHSLLNRYSLIEIDCIDGEKRHAVEVPFRIWLNGITVGGMPVVYEGYIDAILYNHMTDDYEVFDIKTHRKNIRDIGAIYTFDDQCIPYAIVLEKLLGNEINTLTANYLAAYVDVKEPKIQPLSFKKTKADVEDWLRLLRLDLSSMNLYTQMEWFPRNCNSCVNFNQVCKFMEQCHSRDKDYLREVMAMGRPESADRPMEPWVELELELVEGAS